MCTILNGEKDREAANVHTSAQSDTSLSAETKTDIVHFWEVVKKG